MKPFRLLVVLAGLLCLVPSLWAAKLKLEGDLYQYDKEKEKLIYLHPTGEIEGTRISADRLTYDKKEGKIHLVGNLVLKSEGILITADQADYNLDTKIFHIQAAALYDEKNQVFIQAKSLERREGDVYIIRDGSMTICKPDKPGWEIRSNYIVYELDNFAYATNTRLHFLDMPIFYTPFISWPTKRGRASGFLAPVLERKTGDSDLSKNYGTRIKLPYFWAIDQDHDLTATLDSIQLRGPAVELDYLYAFQPGMAGQIKVWALDELIKDRDKDLENMGALTPTQQENLDLRPLRYELEAHHRQNLGKGQLFANQELRSDNELRKEYKNLDYGTDLALHRDLSYVYPWDQGGLSVLVDQGRRFLYQSTFDKSDDRETYLNRLPEITLTQTFPNLGDSPLSLAAEGTHSSYDRVYGWQGQVQRSRLSAGLPFSVDFMNVVPRAERRFYAYQPRYEFRPEENPSTGFEAAPNRTWEVDAAQVEFNFEVFRLFANAQGKAVGRLAFRPRLVFDQVEDQDQRGLLSTTPTAYAFSGQPADYTSYAPMFNDSPLYGRKSMTTGFNSKYLVKNPSTNGVRKALELDLAQIYNLDRGEDLEEIKQSHQGPVIPEEFQETQLGDQKLPLRLRLEIAPVEGFSAGLFYRWDHVDKRILETATNFTTNSSDGSRFSLGYHKNLKQYMELDGTQKTVQKSYGLSQVLRFSDKLEVSLSASWDLFRLDPDRLNSPTDTVERLDRALTYADLGLVYTKDCYKYNLFYEEKIVEQTYREHKRELVEKKVTLSFQLANWPGTVNPYKRDYLLNQGGN